MSVSHIVNVAVLAETREGERRVALVPQVAAKLAASGFVVTIQAGAGESACFSDDAYRAEGVLIEADRRVLLSTADVVLSVQPPRLEDIHQLRPGTVTVSFLPLPKERLLVEALASRRGTAYSLELLPRISRAQSMDALSSQSSLAGYKAVLMAANRLCKFFPLLMTAAGTVPPARVLVLGAGVAGLQAIATARRLGAVIEAYDVRKAAQEDVESLGATFLSLALEAQEGEGGYAREQSEEYQMRQRELLSRHIAAADVVITTAAIPGKQAPLLISTPMVKSMRCGSVIVDMAAEMGGNCELTRAGQVTLVDGVWIDGTTNIPSTMALHASQLYARNVANLLQYLASHGQMKLNFEDDIIKGSCVTYAGQIVNERARKQLGLASTAEAAREEIQR